MLERTTKIRWLPLIFSALVVVAGCQESASPAGACTPGAIAPCTCPNGLSGSMPCTNVGLYSDCVCTGVVGGFGGAGVVGGIAGYGPVAGEAGGYAGASGVGGEAGYAGAIAGAGGAGVGGEPPIAGVGGAGVGGAGIGGAGVGGAGVGGAGVGGAGTGGVGGTSGAGTGGTGGTAGNEPCGSCHDIPPPTGKHPTVYFRHVFLGCTDCHGDISDRFGATITNEALHDDGKVDVIMAGGSYNAMTGSCSPSCHFSAQW